MSRPGSASAAAADIMCQYVKKISQNFNLFLLQNLRKGKRKSLNLVRRTKKQEEGSKVTNNYVGIDNSVLLQTAQVGLINPNAAGDSASETCV